jgi:hypothetical protein
VFDLHGSLHFVLGPMSVSQTVGMNRFVYFVYQLPSNQSCLQSLGALNFTLTPQSGDPDLYVGVGFVPSTVNRTVSSSRGSSLVDSVNISLQASWLGLPIYIGVRGYSAASFTLTVNSMPVVLLYDFVLVKCV